MKSSILRALPLRLHTRTHTHDFVIFLAESSCFYCVQNECPEPCQPDPDSTLTSAHSPLAD